MEFKVIQETLPAISFNFEELKKALADTLQKYSNAVVTEDNLQGCKATQKELAGIRIKIDTYRKDKKKELSKPITDFENQCKELIDLVEKAEKPIKDGIQVFDDKKRDEKRTTAELLIKHSINKNDLNAKYATQLTVLDKYTNLTAKEKDVPEDIEVRALFLKEQQTKEAEMLEIIKDTIENANKNINAKLSLADFQRLINAGTSTKEIMAEINARAERTQKAEIAAEESRIRKEEEAKLAEEEKAIITELPQETIEAKPVEVVEPTQEVTPTEQPRLHVVEIRITGTAAQTTSVGDFLRQNNITYKLIKHEEIE